LFGPLLRAKPTRIARRGIFTVVSPLQQPIPNYPIRDFAPTMLGEVGTAVGASFTSGLGVASLAPLIMG